MTFYDDDLRLAHVLADAVERLTMSRYQADDLVVESKPDLTPVTDADRGAEELIRMQLKRTRPRDAVEGEEFDPMHHEALMHTPWPSEDAELPVGASATTVVLVLQPGYRAGERVIRAARVAVADPE